jgi:hypothetical protein
LSRSSFIAFLHGCALHSNSNAERSIIEAPNVNFVT